MTAIDIDHLKTWEGREERGDDEVTPQLAKAFAATFDRPPPGADGLVPQGLHWCLAPPAAPTAALGADGHPARGGFLPPVDLPRRMWAGGRLAFHEPIRVGDSMTRLSRVASVAHKAGRTGSLVFVVVQHRVSTPRGVAVVEEHDIVYRGLDGTARGGGDKAPAHSDASRVVRPDAALLFRYSALTFNGHRIHYDRDYVTQVEGYPGLIVHGPLQASLLIALGGEMLDRPLKHFSFRATKPLFDLAPFAIAGARAAERLDLWAADADGFQTMAAQAE